MAGPLKAIQQIVLGQGTAQNPKEDFQFVDQGKNDQIQIGFIRRIRMLLFFYGQSQLLFVSFGSQQHFRFIAQGGVPSFSRPILSDPVPAKRRRLLQDMKGAAKGAAEIKIFLPVENKKLAKPIYF